VQWTGCLCLLFTCTGSIEGEEPDGADDRRDLRGEVVGSHWLSRRGQFIPVFALMATGSRAEQSRATARIRSGFVRFVWPGRCSRKLRRQRRRRPWADGVQLRREAGQSGAGSTAPLWSDLDSNSDECAGVRAGHGGGGGSMEASAPCVVSSHLAKLTSTIP
jgi:hypothetical protein